MADSPPSPCPGRGCWGKGKRTPFLRPVGEISTKCAKTFLYMFLVSLKLIIFGGENGNRFSPGGGFLCMKRKQRRRMPHLTWKHRPLPMSVPTGADSRLMVPLAFGFPVKKWPEYLCIRGIFILSLSHIFRGRRSRASRYGFSLDRQRNGGRYLDFPRSAAAYGHG